MNANLAVINGGRSPESKGPAVFKVRKGQTEGLTGSGSNRLTSNEPTVEILGFIFTGKDVLKPSDFKGPSSVDGYLAQLFASIKENP